MIQRIVDSIVEKQIENKMIPQDEINIYKYGYFLLFEALINIIISFLVGLVFNDLKTVIVFLVLYMPLRTYSGGWHADKLWKCTFISNLILVIIEIFVNYCIDYIPVMYCIPLIIIFQIYILLVSPVDTEAKPLSKEEKSVYRNKLKVIQLFHILVLILFILMKSGKSIIIIEYVYMVQALMLKIEKNKKY